MSNEFRTTKYGVAICPFFGWQSENIERLGQSEEDVNLTNCSHPKNELGDYEGNCQEEVCPLLKEPKK